MSVVFFAPDRDLVKNAGDIILGSSAPEKNIAVFPGRRPSFLLRRYIGAELGRPVISPRIFSMDEFVDYALSLSSYGISEAPRPELIYLLVDLLRERVCMTAGLRKDIPLEYLLPWAVKILSALEEFKIERKTESEVKECCGLMPSEYPLSGERILKIENFGRLYGEFYGLVESRGYCTRAMKYSSLADMSVPAGLSDFEHVIFSGFFTFSASERIFLKKYNSAGAEFYSSFGEGIDEQFRFLGGAEKVGDTARPLGNINFYRATDSHSEIFKLAELLSKTPEKPDDNSAVTVADPAALFPLIQNALPFAGECNISMGYPVKYSAVGALTDILAETVPDDPAAGFASVNFIKFILQPYIKNIKCGGVSETGRRIVQITTETVTELAAGTVSASDFGSADTAVAAAMAGKCARYGFPAAEAVSHIGHILKHTLLPFTKIYSLADFSDKLIGLFDFLTRESTAPLHDYWNIFAEAAVQPLLELKKSSLSGIGFAKNSSYFKFYKELINSVTYPFSGTPVRGLQVLGLLETRALRFKKIYFLDANAGILPRGPADNDIIPYSVRRRLGISTYKTAEKIARYYFDVFVRGAEEANIFYEDNEKSERSPFVEKMIWELERSGKRVRDNHIFFSADFSQTETVPALKKKAQTDLLKTRAFSPSALDTYLRCGLKFYYRYVLGLEEKEELDEDTDKKAVGITVHKILQDFFSAYTGRAAVLSAADRERLMDTAERTVNLRWPEKTAVNYMLRSQIIRRMSDIFGYHKTLDFSVYACERTLKASIVTKFGDINLTGRADRIDVRGGLFTVIDYKTGSSAKLPSARFDINERESWHRTLSSVQLPFYIMAFSQTEGVAPEEMQASLMMLGAREINEQFLFAGGPPAEIKKALIADYRSALTRLIEEILDDGVPFSPAADEKYCGQCPYRTVCGRQWISAN